MTTDGAAETFHEKAPLLSRDDLARIVREDLLDETLTEAARAGWLYGSFADPDQPVDSNRSNVNEYPVESSSNSLGTDDLAGLKVYVVMEGWGNQEASTRFTPTSHGLLWRLAAQEKITVYGGGTLTNGIVGVPVRTEPPELNASLERAERAAFQVREIDRERRQFRALDLLLGGRDAFELLLGDAPRLALWGADTEGERNRSEGA